MSFSSARNLSRGRIELGAILDRLANRPRFRNWAEIFVPTLFVYLLTTNYGPDAFIDGAVAYHPAWHLVHHGHIWLEDGDLRFWMIVEGREGHLVSNRPPGLVALVVPFYAVLSWGSGAPSPAPAAIAAAVSTAVAIATLRLLLDEIGPPRLARSAAFLAAFGTSAWSVAAEEYFPHGPDAMWLSLALLALVRGREWVAGCCLAAAITTRPHLAVVALVLGLGLAWTRRRWQTAVGVGIPATAGLAAVLLYNRIAFDSSTIQGGYGDYVNRPLETAGLVSGLGTYGLNVLGAMFSGPRGLLVLSPFLLVLLPGLRRAWKQSPDWTRMAALAALCYALVQWRIQSDPLGFLGGYAFYSYRYLIEPLILLAPLLFVSFRETVLPSRNLTRAFVALAAVAVWIHTVGAVIYDLTANMPWHPWLGLSPATTLASANAWQLVFALAAGGLAALAVRTAWNRDAARRIDVAETDHAGGKSNT